MPDTIKLLIVDDEQDACDNLEILLRRQADVAVNIAGIAHNTTEAEQLIRLQEPDVLFLDIDMPGEDAFRFLERLARLSFEIIFVTAYDEYAVRAFRLNAVDYLLKPAGPEDISLVLQKLQARLQYRHLQQLPEQPFEHLSAQLSGGKAPDKIFLKELHTTEVVAFTDILYTEAKGSYSKIVFRHRGTEKQVVMSYPIAMYETLFPGAYFYRIHKSYLLNCRFIEKITGGEHPAVVLKNGRQLPVGRRRYASMLSFLKTNHLP